MAESYEGVLSLSEIRVDEKLWGPGSEAVVKTWLGEHFDPDTMPRLQVATIVGREGLWLLGWNHEGTTYPPLLELIFGEDYARAQLDQADAVVRDGGEIPDGTFGQGRP